MYLDRERAATTRLRLAASITELKASTSPRLGRWYSHDAIGNLEFLENFLAPVWTPQFEKCFGIGILDLGFGDGELSCLVKSLGYEVHGSDTKLYNPNALTAVESLKASLGLSFPTVDVNLEEDSAWQRLPQEVGFAFALGVLYHLENPIAFLKRVSSRSNYLVLSSRVLPPQSTAFMPFLTSKCFSLILEEGQIDGDISNFSIPSSAALHRMCRQSNWKILHSKIIRASPFKSGLMDYREFVLLESNLRCRSGFALGNGWHPVPQAMGPTWSSTQFSLLFTGQRTFSFFIPESLDLALRPLLEIDLDGVVSRIRMERHGNYSIPLSSPEQCNNFSARLAHLTCIGFQYPPGPDIRDLGVILLDP